jgi:hypothetical protein
MMRLTSTARSGSTLRIMNSSIWSRFYSSVSAEVNRQNLMYFLRLAFNTL